MSIKLLPGFSRIELEGLATADTGPIVLTERMGTKKVCIGRVKDSRITDHDRGVIGTTDLVGRRILFHHRYGRALSDTESIIPNVVALDEERTIFMSTLLAIVPDDAKFGIGNIGDGDRRCRHCGPANRRNSENNVMLAPHPKHGWYCPRCYRNESGDKINPSEII